MVDLTEQPMPVTSRNWLARGAALLLPLVTCAILAGTRDSVTVATAALILVVWVVGAAASGDRVAGVLAALSAAVWFDFFLTEPFQRFTINDADDVEVTVLLMVIGLLVSEIALWGRRQQARAARRSGYLDGVLSAARVVSEGDAPASAVIGLVARQITEVLGVDRCRFVEGPVKDHRFATMDHDGEVTRAGRPVDVTRHGLPSDEEVVIVVRRAGEVLGHFVVTAATRVAYPSLEQRRVAVLLADQVAPTV
jgi:K+-sensing histidine kinase KdpD